MDRTIRVTGKGKISVKPDTIRILINMSSVEETYEKAITESGEKKAELAHALEKIGFKSKDLKTVSFHVNTEYESYQDQNNFWKQRLLGYKYMREMKLQFPMDAMKLGQVAAAIAHCSASPEFSIEYTVADPEAMKNALIARAVADSKAKAEVIAIAAGVGLGEIQVINYSKTEPDFTVRPVNQMVLRDVHAKALNAGTGSIDLSIDADDIIVTDTITIIWSMVTE